MKKPWVLSYPLSPQRRLWSDWADAQADLHLCWAHTHFFAHFWSQDHQLQKCRKSETWLSKKLNNVVKAYSNASKRSRQNDKHYRPGSDCLGQRKSILRCSSGSLGRVGGSYFYFFHFRKVSKSQSFYCQFQSLPLFDFFGPLQIFKTTNILVQLLPSVRIFVKHAYEYGSYWGILQIFIWRASVIRCNYEQYPVD